MASLAWRAHRASRGPWRHWWLAHFTPGERTAAMAAATSEEGRTPLRRWGSFPPQGSRGQGDLEDDPCVSSDTAPLPRLAWPTTFRGAPQNPWADARSS